MRKVKFIDVFTHLAFMWVVFALSFQVVMLTLNVVNPQLETKIGNEIMWKLDGRFSN
jgi:hypothetical protein